MEVMGQSDCFIGTGEERIYLNLILMLDYYSNEIPVFDNFNNGFAYLKNQLRKHMNLYSILLCSFYKKQNTNLLRLQSIEIELNYNSQNEMYSYGIGIF